MREIDRYDSLIKFYSHFFDMPWLQVKRQIEAESSFRPQVMSDKGAIGLMQFMPGTWSWAWKEIKNEGLIDRDYEPWIKNPEDSIFAGCWYDRWLFKRYSEIPNEIERWKFAIAAYNCGRGNVNKALHLARKYLGQPASFEGWINAGRPSGVWQEWDFTVRFLPVVTGSNASKTNAYVNQIVIA